MRPEDQHRQEIRVEAHKCEQADLPNHPTICRQSCQQHKRNLEREGKLYSILELRAWFGELHHDSLLPEEPRIPQ